MRLHVCACLFVQCRDAQCEGHGEGICLHPVDETDHLGFDVGLLNVKL